MNTLTILIPTHERHSYLERSMSYFSNLVHRVIYCDSSKNTYSLPIPTGIEYIHKPGLQFKEKVLHILEEINTDYVVMCADDDFISLQSLNEGLVFLQINTEYKTLLGRSIGFNKPFDGKFFNLFRTILKDIEPIAPKDRASQFFTNYHNTLWCLYNYEILLKAFITLNSFKFKNDNLIELSIGSIACYSGKIKELDIIWSIREISSDDHWGKRHLSLHKSFDNLETRKEIESLVMEINKRTETGFGEYVLDVYLKPKSNIKLTIKQSLINLIPGRIRLILEKKFKKQVFFQNKELDTIGTYLSHK